MNTYMKTVTKRVAGRRVITREIRVEDTTVRKKRVVMCRGYAGASGKSTMRNTLGYYGKEFNWSRNP